MLELKQKLRNFQNHLKDLPWGMAASHSVQNVRLKDGNLNSSLQTLSKILRSTKHCNSTEEAKMRRPWPACHLFGFSLLLASNLNKAQVLFLVLDRHLYISSIFHLFLAQHLFRFRNQILSWNDEPHPRVDQKKGAKNCKVVSPNALLNTTIESTAKHMSLVSFF